MIKTTYSIESDIFKATSIFGQLQNDIKDVQITLITTKIRQAHQINAHQSIEKEYYEKNFVILSTKNYIHKYKSKRDKYSAKFILRYNGP